MAQSRHVSTTALLVSHHRLPQGTLTRHQGVWPRRLIHEATPNPRPHRDALELPTFGTDSLPTVSSSRASPRPDRRQCSRPRQEAANPHRRMRRQTTVETIPRLCATVPAQECYRRRLAIQPAQPVAAGGTTTSPRVSGLRARRMTAWCVATSNVELSRPRRRDARSGRAKMPEGHSRP